MTRQVAFGVAVAVVAVQVLGGRQAAQAPAPGAPDGGTPPAARQAAPPHSQARHRQLEDAYDTAYAAHDWRAAIAAAEEWVALDPADGQAAYSLACAYALDGQREAAIAWLQRAAERQFAMLDLFDADPDLAALRSDARVTAVRDAIARNQAAVMAGVAQRISQAPIAFHVSPAAFDRGTARSPLLVALHGFGSSPAEMVPAFERFADAAGAVLALPQGPTPYGSGFDWVSANHAEAVVMRTLDQARQRYRYDTRQVVITGFSQGADMAMRVALRHPEIFRGVIAMAGRYNPSVVPGVNADARARELRLVLMVGAEDAVAQNNRETEQRLKAAKFDVRLRVFPKVGHRLPPNAVAEFGDAFKWATR